MPCFSIIALVVGLNVILIISYAAFIDASHSSLE
nr:MAG TPA: hypothetical protein [Bacteriophage sp.]